jgi:hypothetical protein
MKYIKPRFVYLNSASSAIQGTKTGIKSLNPTDGAQSQPSSTTAGAYEVDE